MKKLNMEQKSTTIGGLGYKWKCKTTGFVSKWHLTNSGASKLAIAHQEKYPGHKTTVFAV
jgi:hypothetical protein